MSLRNIQKALYVLLHQLKSCTGCITTYQLININIQVQVSDILWSRFFKYEEFLFTVHWISFFKCYLKASPWVQGNCNHLFRTHFFQLIFTFKPHTGVHAVMWESVCRNLIELLRANLYFSSLWELWDSFQLLLTLLQLTGGWTHWWCLKWIC